jgi:hypothetical protein
MTRPERTIMSYKKRLSSGSVFGKAKLDAAVIRIPSGAIFLGNYY